MPRVFDFDTLDALLAAWELENQIPKRARRDAELRGRLGSDAAARAFEQLRSDKALPSDEGIEHIDRVDVVARALVCGAAWVQEEARAARDPKRPPLEMPAGSAYAYRYVHLLGEAADLAGQIDAAHRKRRSYTERLEEAAADVAAQRVGMRRLLAADPDMEDVLVRQVSPLADEVSELLASWRQRSPWIDLAFRVHGMFVAVNDRERANVEDETRSFLHRIVGRLGSATPPMSIRYRVHVELTPVSTRLDDKSGVGSTLARASLSSVEEYTDFEAFLRSRRPGTRRGDAVSAKVYREWSDALYESRETVVAWFEGHAVVPRKRIVQLGELLGLEDAELQAFERLHSMNHGVGEERKNARRAWAEAVVATHGRLIEPDAQKSMVHWYDWAIREIASLRDVADDPAALAALLGPPITVAEVEDSLARLRQDGIINPAGGRLRAAPIAIDPASTPGRVRVPQYELHGSIHRRAVVPAASASPHDSPVAGTVLLSLAPTDWPKLDEACRRYCHAVLGDCSSSRAEKTRVLQVALHVFPAEWRRFAGAPAQ